MDYNDVERRIPPNEETIFPICSTTKGLVSSLVGMLAEEGKVDFDDRVCDLLPAYNPSSPELKTSARLSDWMSMQSGTEPYQVWFQSENNIIFPKSDAMKIVNSLQPESSLRTKFDYSNWGYEIAAQVIKELTGESWDALLHTRIFEPLGLKRTDARGDLDHFDNVAKAYTVLDDGTPVNIPRTPISGKTILGAGGGVHSCVKDLGSIFKRLTTTMSAHSRMQGPSFHESTYGLGWLRTQLPNQMCKISPNLAVLGDEPVLGGGAPSQLLIAHYGSMPGAYCGVNLFPETNSLIVLLTNSTPMCDMADWAIQLITQTLFDFPQKNNYVDWVQATVDAEKRWYPETASKLEKARHKGTNPRTLDHYVGTYVNMGKFFTVTIFKKQDRLFMKLQDLEDEIYPIEHYEYDTFCWLQSRNNLVSRGRWILQHPEYYLIRFDTGGGNVVDRFIWVNDPGIPQGEVFAKQKD
ncbi:beta-lactamase/transpeptidase-like protein [Hypoxylon crocopeplum]|nr:beta-lactamase/transpeptidase-like protein [Hypoxylon crocopeplum]